VKKVSDKPNSKKSFLRHPILHVTLIIFSTIIVYSNSLHNGMYFDDVYGILDNPEIRHVSPVWRHFFDPRTISSLDRITQYRPLLPLSFSINYYLAGGHSLPGYHGGNILLQVIASVLVYFLIMELLGKWAASKNSKSVPENHSLFSFCVALIFAVHPVSGIPVNYIFARDLLLMEVFVLGSFLVYVRMRREGDSTIGWSASLLLFLLALFSKTNAVAVPALVFIFEFFLSSKRLGARGVWLRPMPFVGVIIGFFAFTKYVLHFSDLSQAVPNTSSLWLYGLTQAKIHLFHYMRNFIWPFQIRMLPAVEKAQGIGDVKVLLGLCFIVGTLAFAWAKRKAMPLLSFSICAYWVLIAPDSSIVPLYYEAAYYRPYPGSPFLMLAVALLAVQYLAPRYRAIPAALLVLYFGLASVYLNGTWKSAEAMWSHSVRFGGDATAHMNLAMSIPDRKDPRVRMNLEEALRLSPDYILARINLGLLLLNTGEPQKGIKLIESAVSLAPQWAQSHYWLAQAYTSLGRLDDAFTESERAAELDRRNIEYQYKAAWDAYLLHRYDESLKYLEQVEAKDPGYEQTLFLKGFALQMLGRLDDSIASYRKFLTVEGDNYQVHFNLAFALMMRKEYGEAADHFKRALELKPDYREAQIYLDKCSAYLKKS
jgi:tetratricopeptide (TPR) repeat protein